MTVRHRRDPGGAPGARRKPRPWETAPGAYLRNVRDGARFLVTGGRDILVEPRGGSDHVVGLFLTGPVFAALLQQRGVALLHAGAIETGAGAVLFAGDQGSGKSSLLAALVERGYAMLADGVTGVVPDAGGGAVALSAFPRMKLWADTLDALAWQERARGRVLEGWEKYLVPVERFRTTPLAVRAVCVLGSHQRERIEVRTAPPADAFGWLCRHTYRGQVPARARAAAGPLPYRRGAGEARAGRGCEEARVSVPARRAGGSNRGVAAGDGPAGSPGRDGHGTRHREPHA